MHADNVRFCPGNAIIAATLRWHREPLQRCVGNHERRPAISSFTGMLRGWQMAASVCAWIATQPERPACVQDERLFSEQLQASRSKWCHLQHDLETRLYLRHRCGTHILQGGTSMNQCALKTSEARFSAPRQSPQESIDTHWRVRSGSSSTIWSILRARAEGAFSPCSQARSVLGLTPSISAKIT